MLKGKCKPDFYISFFDILHVFVPILIFQTVLVCQSYNGGLWSPPQRACTEKSKLYMI